MKQPIEIATTVNRYFNTAEDAYKNIAQAREKALKFYRQETGQYIKRISADHSAVTTSNVRDTVETILPQVLEPFLMGEAVVFTGDGTPQDKAMVEAETKAVNRVLDVDNNRFELFEMWFRDALLQKNGYVKTFVKEVVTRKPENVENLNADQLAQLQMTLEQQEIDDLTIEAMIGGEVIDLATATEEQLMMALYSVSFVHVKRKQVIKVANVAPENLRVHPAWDKVYLTGCHYVGESIFLLRGELKEMYPDKADAIDTFPPYFENDTTEHTARRQDAMKGLVISADDKEAQMVEFREHYVRADFDGTGVLKTWKVCTGGGDSTDILDIRQVDDNPYDVVTPIRQPHQHFGLSIADLMIDVDEIDTVIWRSSLDGMYRSLQPRPVVDMSRADPETTFSDLASTHPMAPIRVNGDANAAIGWVSPPDTSKYAQQMFPLVDAMLEKRTGMSRMAQGLDATALADSTNQVGSMVMNQSLQRVKMILRTFAETGVRNLMLRIRRLMLELGMLPQGIPVERDVEAKVGVGLTDRMERMASNERVLTLVEKIVAAQGGVDPSGLVGPQNVFAVLMDYLKDMNVANRSQYIQDPAQVPPPPQEETPVDAALEVEKGKMMVTANAKAAELEFERKKHNDEVRLKLLEIQIQAREQDRKFQQEVEKLRLQASLKANPAQPAPEGSVRAKYGI